MKLELDVYSSICETKTFVINGIKASYKDFGRKIDTQPDKSRPNACGNMTFESFAPAQQILDKYGISSKEYNNICILLRSCISFGVCRQCV
ncbi:hypothetical protein LY28_00263 [Ruminiclostridium sufflavum DSM 19573]|uniref:Uncharacterized protein n=1 Tax=Ruminiclostridium sufflavum DSM 19573 TaxID=1121337 RepID=A0A318XUM9_9FIRM|nr:hypothetical protein [Ruminiclostridium sufflavum]PYG90380.1 hypothetical protein LY28_00263 [Ruminiclostridium sufflavum DSM 19573]